MLIDIAIFIGCILCTAFIYGVGKRDGKIEGFIYASQLLEVDDASDADTQKT